MKTQKVWLTKIFCFFAFFLAVMLLHPADKAYAGTTYLTMTVGETKTVYPRDDDRDYRSRTVRSGGGWLNYGIQYYDILSDTSQKYSCKIKAKKATSSPVILRLDYYYLVAVGTYTYQATGYVDYQITIVDPSGSSGGGSTGGGTTGHTHSWYDSKQIKANTCTQSGQMMQKCSYCSQVRYITLPKKGHSLKKVSAKAATTTSAGNIEYWKCSTCQVCFKDSSGKEEIAESSTILKKLDPPSSAGSAPSTAPPAAPASSGAASTSLEYKITGSGSNKTITVTGVKGAAGSLTALTIGDTAAINGTSYKITAIAAGAFKNCKKLKTVTIGNNVSTIGQSSFSGCTSLTKVTIGTRVKKISKKAFYNCKKLKQITIKSKKLKTVGTSAIKNINKKASIKAPSGKVGAYRKLFKSKTGFRKTMKIKK